MVMRGLPPGTGWRYGGPGRQHGAQMEPAPLGGDVQLAADGTQPVGEIAEAAAAAGLGA